MPFLCFKGIDKDNLMSINDSLINKLSEGTNIPNDYFVVELDGNIPIYNVYPFVEIKWFDRGQEVKDLIASIIYNNVKKIDIDEIEIVFTNYEEDNYYLNDKKI